MKSIDFPTANKLFRSLTFIKNIDDCWNALYVDKDTNIYYKVAAQLQEHEGNIYMEEINPNDYDLV